MTTSRSDRTKIRNQAVEIVMRLKTRNIIPPGQETVRIAIVQDDKISKIELTTKQINNSSAADLIDFIVQVMTTAVDGPQ